MCNDATKRRFLTETEVLSNEIAVVTLRRELKAQGRSVVQPPGERGDAPPPQSLGWGGAQSSNAHHHT